MMNFIEKKFVKYYLGSKDIRTHIDAVHACPPNSDKFTGEIVEGMIDKINCSGIIATKSRTIVDLNRQRNESNKEAIDEYRITIRDILKHVGILNENEKLLKPYLHLAVHGMKDRINKDIEIGTSFGKSCSPKVKKWFEKETKKHFRRVQIDGRFCGDPSKSVHRCGDKISDPEYLGYGKNYNTIQIEISRTLREKHQEDIINIFCNIIKKFNKEFI